ncbi:MAG TPA: GTA-gp10 family protein [Allosphingosinicella sp.]|jgi:hypothetical protein
MAPRSKTAQVNRRGELTLNLGGATYGLRPSFEAIEAIESKVRPLDVLVETLNQGRVPLAELGIITAELMRGYGASHPDDPMIATYRGSNPEKLARLIYEEGVPTVRIVLLVILAGALTGGYDAAGEVKATGTTKATPAAGSSE